MASPTENRDGEAGFTLVELLVAMTISLVVVFATLSSLDVFSSNAAHQTRVTDANDRVRSTMDRVVRDLRGASLIARAGATDLVYYVPEPTGVRMERLCVTSDHLYGKRTLGATAPAAPSEDCSNGSQLAALSSTASTEFTYDSASNPANPALVKNVGLTFSLAASGSGKSASSTLRASAARRSASTLPVTDTDLDTVCNSDGALLTLSASIPGATGALTVTYAAHGGAEIGLPGVGGWQIPKGITSIVATITDAAGVTSTIEKDIECGTGAP